MNVEVTMKENMEWVEAKEVINKCNEELVLSDGKSF